jgi:hypothetical protein
MYQFSEFETKESVKFRGLFLYTLGMSKEDYSKLVLMKRGLKISKGQKASEKFISMMREKGAKLFSSWRISYPQRVLFALIKTVDPDSSLEHRVENKSFDILSPAQHAVIEMHGDFWHKIGEKSKKMAPLILKNIENDKVGLRYIVFWQSQHDNWVSQIEGIYGTRPSLTLQEAENQIHEEFGIKGSLRS